MHYTKGWPKDRVDFIAAMANTKQFTCQQITDAFNEHFDETKTLSAIKSIMRKHGLGVGLNKKGDRYTELWPKEYCEWIEANCQGKTWAQVLEEFNEHFGINYPLNQLIYKAKNAKWRNGYDAKFKKGAESWQKGRPLNEKQRTTLAKYHFEKGHRPLNQLPIGTERVDQMGYTWVKLSEHAGGKKYDNWQPKHKWLWEQAHGPLEEGQIVIFLDGDKTNFDLDNLEAITKAENAILNIKGWRSEDPDLSRIGVAAARIVKEAARRQKEESNGKG